MDQLARTFLANYDERTATDMVCLARCSGMPHLGAFLGRYLQTIFPHSCMLNLEHSANLHHSGKHRDSFLTTKRVLDMRNISEELSKQIISNRRFTIDTVENDWNYYNSALVAKLCNRRKRPVKLITFTMTTCKRFELFTQTMNTFLNCCTDIDLIDEWYCIDDSSSEEDRRRMCTMYPFVTFLLKNRDQKGHPQSMNIIRDMVNTPYLFHLEDDWKFFEQRPFISELLEVLGQDRNFGQVLINKNYSEIASDVILGGEFKQTNTGLRYYVHEYVTTDEEKNAFN
jgi:hypothetical protein